MTSQHLRRAVSGAADSVAWLVVRLTPALEQQARYRLKGPIASWCTPEDLVQDVWLATLPRLADLRMREQRLTPVLIRFLSTTLLHKVNELNRAYLRGSRPRREGSGTGGPAEGLQGLADTVGDALAGAALAELRDRVRQAIDALEERDREVLVLRGIEQLPNSRVADLLDEKPSTITMRYRRALERLRQRLPDSLFADLEAACEENLDGS